MLPFTMLAAWRTAAGDLPEEPAPCRKRDEADESWLPTIGKP